jgi:hypothetical protein
MDPFLAAMTMNSKRAGTLAGGRDAGPTLQKVFSFKFPVFSFTCPRWWR